MEKSKINLGHLNSNIWCYRHIIRNATHIRIKAIETTHPQKNLLTFSKEREGDTLKKSIFSSEGSIRSYPEAGQHSE